MKDNNYGNYELFKELKEELKEEFSSLIDSKFYVLERAINSELIGVNAINKRLMQSIVNDISLINAYGKGEDFEKNYKLLWERINEDIDKILKEIYKKEIEKMCNMNNEARRLAFSYLVDQLDEFYNAYKTRDINEEKEYRKIGDFGNKYSLDLEGFIEYLSDRFRYLYE